MSGTLWRLIESAQNPQFKIWNDLQDGRGIKKHGAFILAGRKAVPEALARHCEHFLQLIEANHAETHELNIAPHIDRFRVTRALFDKLDLSGTNYPLLVGRADPLPVADLSSPPQGLELLVALGDPNNLGAVCRSAAAFGATKVILMEEAAHPFHPKALRAGANAQLTLTFARGPSLRALGKTHGVHGVHGVHGPVVALDGAGTRMSTFTWPRDVRIVLGEEGLGVPATLEAQRLAISTTGAVESLNATVAASLALYAHYTSVG